ncbi:histone-fold-containing protein [Cladochytrium replicatum]|nr:histone-fold-containing protein [Cladochytrium replicatum]
MADKKMPNLEELDMPRAVISRIIKGALPDNAQVQKEAKAAMSRAATVFMSYIGTIANEIAKERGRKSITPPDVFEAIEQAELANGLLPQVQELFNEYQTLTKERRQGYRDKAKQKKLGEELASNSSSTIQSVNPGMGGAEPVAPNSEVGDVVMGQDGYGYNDEEGQYDNEEQYDDDLDMRMQNDWNEEEDQLEE